MKLLHKPIAAILSLVLAVMILSACSAQSPSEGEIYIAGKTVIRVRTKGDYSSVRNRAKAVDKAITEVISTQDTQDVQLTKRQEDGLWTIYCGDIKIVSVQPEEAQVNDVAPQELAQIWIKQLEQTLPQATPGSKLPPSAFQPRPTTTAPPAPGTEEPPQPAPPPKPERVSPVGGEEEAAEEPTQIVDAAVLLVRDYLNTARALPEEEYVTKRDEIIRHMIRDLTPFITGRVPSEAAPTPAPEEEEEQPAPDVGTMAPPPTAPAEEEEGPAIEPTDTAPAAQDLPEVKPGDPAYAKVPQKNRIRKKLEAARVPYFTLRKQSREQAQPVSDLLKSCRSAYARGKYEESERYIDSALKLLGVEY